MTKRRGSKRVQIIGEALPYRDHAEDRILDLLQSADDRSSQSDELAAQISDWPSRYHLSQQRSNLLRPFTIDPTMKVLDVGAGTGSIARYLGECGASVVALEGALPRAEAAAVRCTDLENVEVLCGDIHDLEAEASFDLAIVVGVLEYAGSRAGGKNTPESFLHRVASFLKPGGAVILAIENQIGLKYLLGYAEDHLGYPWVGLEDYPDSHGIRTFSRHQLGQLLSDAGLESQTWLYPFPDYKHVTSMLTDTLYEMDQSTDIIDQLVGRPIRDDAHPRHLLCDDRQAHRVFLGAGLGREVANSFVVLATLDEQTGARFLDSDIRAWHFGKERPHQFTRHQRIRENRGEFRVTAEGSVSQAADWLEHHPAKDQPFFIGRTFEQKALQACRQHDDQVLKQVLKEWYQGLEAASFTNESGEPHPYLHPNDDVCLPPEYLDVSLSNFVATETGSEFIDREWRAAGGVSRNLAILRALWYFAQTLVFSGAEYPWDPSLTVAELTTELGRIVGIADPDIQQLVEAEAALQAAISGIDDKTIEKELTRLSALARSDDQLASTTPATRLRAMADRAKQSYAELEEQTSGLQHQIEHARHYQETLESELEANRKEYEKLESHARHLESDLQSALQGREELEQAYSDLEGHIEDLAAARDRPDDEAIERMQEHIRQLENELALARHHIDYVETALIAGARQYSSLESHTATVDEQLKSILREHEKLAAARVHDERELARAKRYSNKLEREIPRLEQLVEETEKAREEAAQHALHTENEIQKSLQQYTSLEEHLKATVNELETTQNHRHKLERHLQEIETEYGSLEKHAHHLSEQLSATSTALQEIEIEHSRLAQNFSRLETHAHQVETQLESVEAYHHETLAVLQGKTRELEAANEALDELRRRHGQLGQDYHALEDHLTHTEKDLHLKTSFIQELENSLRETRDSNHDLGQQITSLSAEIEEHQAWRSSIESSLAYRLYSGLRRLFRRNRS